MWIEIEAAKLHCQVLVHKHSKLTSLHIENEQQKLPIWREIAVTQLLSIIYSQKNYSVKLTCEDRIFSLL